MTVPVDFVTSMGTKSTMVRVRRHAIPYCCAVLRNGHDRSLQMDSLMLLELQRLQCGRGQALALTPDMGHGGL